MRIVGKLLAWLAVLAVLSLGFAWLAGWFNTRAKPGTESLRGEAEPSSKTAEVMKETVETFLPVPGRLRAAERTLVTSEILGKIAEMAVSAGDQVDVGTVLVRLDQTELAARVDRIREQLPARHARVKEAQAEFDRDKRLLEQDAVAREAFETSRRLLTEAEAGVAATEQELEAAEAQLAETVIKATVPGTVVDQLAKAGEVARPGEPLLEVYQPHTLRLECSIPESLAETLRSEQLLRAEFRTSPGHMQVTIDEIVPQADARSHTVLVKARLERTDSLFEGQYGRLFVPLGKGEKILIPRGAVQSLGQLDFVEVVSAQQTRERRFVKLGLPTSPERIEVLSGLSVGEQVVVASHTDSSSQSIQD